MRKNITLTKKKSLGLLKKIPDWKIDAGSKKISRTYTFENHVQALVFIARITVHAEVLQHHPDISFTYAKVKVTLTTHSVKGLTQKDFDLAKRISKLD